MLLRAAFIPLELRAMAREAGADLAVAGNDTTRTAISYAMQFLTENPEQRRIWQDDIEGVTPTAIARAGPIAWKMLSELSTSAMNATITAPPAEAMASPARARAYSTDDRGSTPCRSRSR